MLLPKKLREKAGIKAGDRFVAIACKRGRNLSHHVYTGKENGRRCETISRPVLKGIVESA